MDFLKPQQEPLKNGRLKTKQSPTPGKALQDGLCPEASVGVCAWGVQHVLVCIFFNIIYFIFGCGGSSLR